MSELGRSAIGDLVAIDVGKLVETHLGVVANPGGGKSYTVRKLLELAAGGPQRIVLDVEDEFYTLREASPSLIIAGGSNGDCPALVENAAALAVFLLETGADAVIQINDLGLSGQQEFIRCFLEAMISAPAELWHPALVVLDEVHRIAPNSGVASSTDAVMSLLLQGRKRGFGALIATQRFALVSTTVRAAINNWLLGRAGLDIDRTAVARALGVRTTSEEARALPTLAPGQFWGYGPAIGQVPQLIKIARTETTHIRPGQRDVPTPPAPERIRAMLQKLRVEPAAATAATGEAPKPSADELRAAERRGYDRGKAEAQAEAAGWRQDAIAAMDAVTATLAPYCHRVPPREQPVDRGDQGAVEPDIEEAAKVTPARQRILDAVAWLRAAGIEPASRVQVGLLSDYSHTSSSFANYLSALRTAGLVDYPTAGDVILTELGREAATAPDRPLTSTELHAKLRHRLGGAKWSVLHAIIRAYPQIISRDQVAEDSRYSVTSSSFANYVSALKTLGLIEYPAKGSLKAARLLFIDDRPRAVASH